MSEITTVQEPSRTMVDEMQDLQQACQDQIARRPPRGTSNARLFDAVSLPMMQYFQQPAGER